MNSFQYLFEIPLYQSGRIPQKVAAGVWRQGIKKETSSEQLVQTVDCVAIKLLEKGTKKGDRILLISDKYDVQWLAIDIAIMSTGAISVPLHFPMRKEEISAILARIEPTIIIYTSKVDLSLFGNNSNIFSSEEFISGPNPINEEELNKLKNIRQSILQDDIATIVHTSGSSGEPRAVALSHQNLISNLLSVLSIVPFTPGTRVMSFLPLSHIFERMVCYVYLASGCNIYFLDSYRYAIYALKDVRPAFFTSVPLVLERFAAVMEDRIEEASWFTRWAYNSWEKTNKGLVSHLGSIIAHQLIIKRWKRRMGGHLRGIISGAAYLDPKVEKLYERSGIKIRQGYGLTEASPVVTINRFEPGGHKRGTVGQPIPGVEVKINEDGEILVKGPNVMAGYYKDENATKHVIRDGWLYTGDIGHWEKDNFLVISDRKSSIYKHASGKFISPSQIESKLTQHSLIAQAMIIGFMRPYTVALIVPDFEALQKLCEEKNIHWTSPPYMIHNTMVIQIYRDLLDNMGFQSHERIEKFVLIENTWTPENGLLTATYKPRRKAIELKYSKAIEELYRD